MRFRVRCWPTSNHAPPAPRSDGSAVATEIVYTCQFEIDQ